jgi:hypothetical protein
MKPQISPRDLRSISQYLDDQLKPSERQHLEKRLQENQALRQALAEMKQTRTLLRSLPWLHSPRNFTLTPQMVGLPSKKSMYSAWGFVSAMASILFVLVLAGDLTGFFSSSSKSVAWKAAPVLEAAAPTIGMVQDESFQAEIAASSFLTETQVVESQLELKAIVPAEDAANAGLSETLLPTSVESGQEIGTSATAVAGGFFAKEAPAPEIDDSGVAVTREEIPPMEAYEEESVPMAALTAEGTTEPLQPVEAEAKMTPTGLSLELTQATELAQAEAPSALDSEGSSLIEPGAQELNEVLVGDEARSSVKQSQQIMLRFFEVFLAVVAISAALLFLSQRRKPSR